MRIEDGTLSSKLAKQVFDGLWAGEGDADQIIGMGTEAGQRLGALESMVDSVIADNPDQVAQYLAADEAKQKLSGFFVGQIMKASKGQANPQMVNELLLKKLKVNPEPAFLNRWRFSRCSALFAARHRSRPCRHGLAVLVKGLHRFQFPQPMIDVTFQDRCSLVLIFRCPCHEQSATFASQLRRLANKGEDFFSRLLH